MAIILLLSTNGLFSNLMASSVSVQVRPAAPENAVIAKGLSDSQVILTWNASPSPSSSIASYTIFYKQTSANSYPINPQITRVDKLPNYSQTITVNSGSSYNFIIFANTATQITSTPDCASCRVNYLADSISGATPQNEDNIIPIPGHVSSPAYANTSPFTVTYAGAEDTGGSGLSYVSLFYKKGVGDWQSSGLTSNTSSGSFNFIPDGSPNGVYYFDLQAFDNQGNASEGPSGTGDASTIYDTQSPSIATINVPATAKSLPIIVSYQNASDEGISGLDHVELWYKKGNAGEWKWSGLATSDKNDSFSFEGVDGSDHYYFDLIAKDKAGNSSTEVAETLTPVLYDVDPPNLDSASIELNNQTILVNYQATEVGPAGFKEAELWYKKGSNGSWVSSGLKKQSNDDGFEFLPPSTGDYYFSIVLSDNLMNQSAEPTGDGLESLTVNSPVAILANLPESVTKKTSVDITVGGENIVAYKYKLNDGNYTAPIPIAAHLVLNDLKEGNYKLEVLGKNSLGWWQDISNSTTHEWTIDFSSDLKKPVDDKKPEDQKPLTDQNPEVKPPVEESKAGNEPSPDAGSSPNSGSPNEGGTSLNQDQGEITPPPPALEHGTKEIEEKARKVLTENGKKGEVAKETPPAVTLPIKKEDVTVRLDECKKKYSTLSFDSGMDSDNDGLSDKTECYAFTNPLSADTDKDSCLDGEEVNQFSTDPLNGKDCSLEEALKTVSIMSPKNGWLLSELEVMGVVPDTISLVNLVAFPVVGDQPSGKNIIELGSLKKFSPSSIKNQYFFRFTPTVSLTNGKTYDLIAIGVLVNGDVVNSRPVRFTLDAEGNVSTPKPTAIGDVTINDLNLDNLSVRTDKNGTLRVDGNSEYGAQIFAVWESLVLASSVIADSSLGGFSIESPRTLNPEQKHRVTLYALKQEGGKQHRSRNAELNFYIQKPASVITPALVIVPVLFIASFLGHHFLRAKKRKKKGVKKKINF